MKNASFGWLSFWRVYVGLVWFEYGSSKLEPKWATSEFLAAVQASAPGVHGAVHDFLVGFVVPNQHVFALLIAYGETLVGISLILGLLTKAGAVGGMFLSLNYAIATGKLQLRFGVESLEMLLFVSCLTILVLPSSAFSLDGLIRQKRSKKPPSRFEPRRTM